MTDSVYLSTELATPVSGVRRVVVNNQSARGTTNGLWAFDYATGIWQDKGRVPYQETRVIDGLTDGHVYTLATVDASFPNCRTQRPDEGSCLYQSMSGAFLADDTGSMCPGRYSHSHFVRPRLDTIEAVLAEITI